MLQTQHASAFEAELLKKIAKNMHLLKLVDYGIHMALYILGG